MVIPTRFFCSGDIERAKALIGEGRAHLHQLLHALSFNEIPTATPPPVHIGGGVLIQCVVNYGLTEVHIHVPVIATAEPREAEIDYSLVSLAYAWTWDNSLIPDPPVGTPEEHATAITTSRCFRGSMDQGELVLDKVVVIPTITNQEKPYRVTDLAQVRYTGENGIVSLIMADYCLVADNNTRYTAVSVLGEGGYPSVVVDITLDITEYVPATNLLGTTDCVVEVDAAISLDLAKLYRIIVVRPEGTGVRKAVIYYEILEVDPNTNEWTITKQSYLHAKGSAFATPLLFIMDRVFVDREGSIGVFSQENPVPIEDYEINTSTRTKYAYRSITQKYLFSLETEEFAATGDHAYVTKTVNLQTFDYEVVKSDGATIYYDRTRTYVGSYLAIEEVEATYGASVEIPGFSIEKTFLSKTYWDFKHPQTGYPYPTWTNTYREFPVYNVSGGYPTVLPRRTLVMFAPLSYIETILSQDFDYRGNPSLLYSPSCPEMVTPLNEMNALAIARGCSPDPSPFQVVAVDSYLSGSSPDGMQYALDQSMSYKRFQGNRLSYPVIDTVESVLEAKNAFICCDNALRAAFYGQHIRSTINSHGTVDRQVPLFEDPDTVDEKPYSEWHIKFTSDNMGTMNVTNIVSAKYGDSLLSNITDPELSPQPTNLAPWETDPATYTTLEPFFGIMFYGESVLQEDEGA